MNEWETRIEVAGEDWGYEEVSSYLSRLLSHSWSLSFVLLFQVDLRAYYSTFLGSPFSLCESQI